MYRLAGISGDEVIIEDTKTDKQTILKKGDIIQGFTVTNVEKTKLHLKDAKGNEYIWSMTSGTGTSTPEAVVPETLKPFLIHGTLRDENGKTVSRGNVYLMDEIESGIGFANVDNKGHYQIQVDQ